MAAPRVRPRRAAPTPCLRTYESPPRRPDPWLADRPGELVEAGQPSGPRSATRARPGLRAAAGPPVRGQARPRTPASTSATPSPAAVAVALKRASLFGRAPVVHDLTVALPSGASSATRPAELVAAAHATCSRRWPTRTTTTSCARIVDLVPPVALLQHAPSRSPRPTGPTGAPCWLCPPTPDRYPRVVTTHRPPPAASRPRPRATSTSAGPARCCSTG